ncbi:prelamin-A/C-like [Sardina pilchardus]|uniref:prelamin-A/C-like n=1 Tax=Sardina pilchardus TaxID=27697 RepID=UPI002E1447C2
MVESNLPEALAELHVQHQEQVRISKEEIKNNLKLENTRHSADRNSHLVGAAHEELQQTCMRLEGMSAQLSQLQKQLAVQEAQVHDKHQEVVEVRTCMQMQLEKYQQLLYMKLGLDMEMAAYRKVLDGEEQRLGLSPSPPPMCVTVILPSSNTHMCNIRSKSSVCGKKRCLNDTESEVSSVVGRTVSSTHIVQQGSASGRVTVDKVDLDGNDVRLSNKADQIWAANGGGSHNPPTDLVWKTQNSWGSGDLFQTTLISANGEVRFSDCSERQHQSSNSRPSRQGKPDPLFAFERAFIHLLSDLH